MLLREFLHTAEYQLTKMIQDVSQQYELLGIEQWSINIIQKFGALDGDTHACYLIIFVPELLHLFVKSL